MTQSNYLTDKELHSLLKMFDGFNPSVNFRIREPKEPNYEKAKELETKDRNLKEALRCYALSALYGEKVESSIKDFASVLHQCGRTSQAVTFLERFKIFTKGQKYLNLLQNLRKQITPSMKFHCKKILLINIPTELTSFEICNMFQNGSRIQEVISTTSLDFKPLIDPNYYYKNALLLFQSFSAAKKTLQTFKYDQWFGIDCYWTNTFDLVVCQAFDGRNDFEKIICRHQIYDNTIYSQIIVPQALQIRIPKKILKRITKVSAKKSREQANTSAVVLIKQGMSYIDRL